MKCEQVNERLLAYLDGEMPKQQQAEIAAHLAECPACAAEHETLAALRSDLSATVQAAGAAIRLPPAAEARIASQLEAQMQKANAPDPLAALSGWFERLSRPLAWGLAIVFVGLMIGAGVFLVGRYQRGSQPEYLAEATSSHGRFQITSTPPAEATYAPAPEPTSVVERDLAPTRAPQPHVTAVAEGEKVVTALPEAAVTATPMPMGTATPVGTLAPPNDQTAADMFFKNYGVNPFVDTEDDHLSTFALDVDTGSYTVARRYVRDGHLPPEEAVRVEEFVNYFDYDYDYPPEGQAFAIHLDGAPFPYAETERYRMMRVGLQGYAVPPEERKDVSLVFVIDVSGSMDMENRLELVKRSLELLVEQLRPSDSVGIVVYGSTARVVLEPTYGANQETILRAIYSLHPGGSTYAEAGLLLGYQMANKAYNPEAINRVILCSDGVANVGNTGPQSILKTIEDYAREGITLTTVGFGMGNYNDVLMEQLADNGDGFYAYVDTLAEARRLFVENLSGTLQAIARDAKVQVDFNPEVVARYRLVGFENRDVADADFRNDAVDAGEIGAGHSVTALYEFKLHPGAEGRIATVYLRWEEPETGEVIETNQDFYSSEMAESFTAASPHFQLAIAVSEYAEILRGSYWAEGSTLAGLLEDVERVGELLADDSDVVEFVELVRRASHITR